MSIREDRQNRVGTEPNEVGLLALGSSGSWEMSIDETTSGVTRWFAQIEGPSVYLRFEIESPRIVEQAIAHLSPRDDRTNGAVSAPAAALTLSGCTSSTVDLLHDDEFDDRYFLVVSQADGTLVRLTVAGDDLAHLLAALRKIAGEL